MELNVTHLVRTVAAAAVLLPLTVGFAANMTKEEDKNAQQVIVAETKANLTLPCIQYQASKTDTKLEREAKTAIDEVLGAGEVNHAGLCAWVMR